jgi:ribosome-binding protein aMBF1 (putative translation factor)
MIKNQRQYLITKTQLKKFQDAIRAFDEQKPKSHPLLVKAQKDAMIGQVEELKEQIEEYERLSAGNYKVIRSESIEDLPIELIRARIALGLTQKDLAKRLGLKEQQIQRYENTEYASASVYRLMEIIAALKLNIKKEILLPRDLEKRTAEL